MTTILIVDDRRDSRLVLETKLTGQGFQVTCIDNAKDALPHLIEGGVDIVLMDLNMPDFDGVDAVTEMKNRVETQHIPVILCTAHAIDGDRERALSSGSDGFLEKPIVMEQLLEMMKALLDKWSDPKADSDGPGIAPA